MTAVRPFPAVRYDLERSELSNVIVPPYDVIADDERDGYFERDPHNAIRFELTRKASDQASADYWRSRSGSRSGWRAGSSSERIDPPTT